MDDHRAAKDNAPAYSGKRVMERASSAEKSTDSKFDVRSCANTEFFSTGQYDLTEFVARDNIEGSIDWFELLQHNVFPKDPGVRYYFVAENNRPSTILPLRLTMKGRVRIVEALGNYYTSLYSCLLYTSRCV